MIWFLFFIIFILLTLRQSERMDTSSYVPNPNGHWVNKGTAFDEQWEWWEPEPNNTPLFVSVLEDEGDYKIVIDDQPPHIGIEYVDCKDKQEAEIAVSLFTAYYTVFGSVSVSDLVGLDLNKEVNGG